MFNQITLVGNLGRDPEMRFTPSGVPVTDLSIATSESWTDNNGERQEKTVWIKVTAWRRLAETSAQYLQKGSRVLVIGRLEDPDAYINNKGQAAAANRVTAREIKFLSSPQNGNNQAAHRAPAAEQEPPVYSDEEMIPF